MLEGLRNLIAFALVLGGLIFFHELGHFIVSIKLGVKIKEFGIGFPPRLLRSEEHTSELQSLVNLVCRLLLEKKKNTQ